MHHYFNKQSFFRQRARLQHWGRQAGQIGYKVWKGSSLPKVESWLNTVVSLLLKIGGLLIIAILLILVWRIFKKEGYTIETVDVPEILSKNGFTGVVVARQLQDEYLHLKQIAASIKADSISTSGREEQPELNVAVMGLGISLRSISFHLRELLGRRNDMIRCEITRADSVMSITLRMTGFAEQTYATSLQHGERQAIKNLLGKAAEAIMNNTDPYRLAIYYDRVERYDEGLHIVRNMLKKHNGERHWAYLAWGSILEDQNKLDEALEKFETSSKIKPDFALPLVRRAWLLIRLKSYSKAVEILKQAVTIAPEEPSYWNSYAMALTALKRYQEADVAYSAMQKHSNGNAGWLFSWADSKFSRGDMEGAAAILKTIRQTTTVEAERCVAAGFLAGIRGDTAEVIKNALEVVDLEPGNMNYFQASVAALMKVSAYEKVIYLSNSVVLDTLHKNIQQQFLNTLAMAYNLSGKTDSGRMVILRAIAINPYIGYPYSTLAESYAFEEKHELFYQYLETAFQRGFSPLFLNLTEEPYKRFAEDVRFLDLLKKYEAH